MESLRFEPATGTVLFFGISAGSVASNPLRWEPRNKALVTLEHGAELSRELDGRGLLRDIGLDLGQIISALPRPLYPQSEWERSYHNQVPDPAKDQVLLEYTAHPDACFHLADVRTIPVAEVGGSGAASILQPVAKSQKRARLRVIEKGGGNAVAVKLQVHGQAGEYLAPADRHRIPNPSCLLCAGL